MKIEKEGKKSHQLKKNPHSREGWMKDKKVGRKKQVWDASTGTWKPALDWARMDIAAQMSKL